MVIFRKERAHGARPVAAVLAGLAALLAAAPASAQQANTAPAAAAPAVPAWEPSWEAAARSSSEFGSKLSLAEAGALLGEIRQLAQQALAVSRAAEQGASVAEVKAAADRVVQAVWGIPSGVPAGATGEVQVPGWKELWQVTGAEFDPNFVKRNGAEAPRVTDPRQLGIVGRARAVRGRLEEITDSASRAPAAQKAAAASVAASLSNVVGWMHVTTGFKGREVQPRISLTHLWDAPSELWNSSADTGWLFEAYSQAVNILKTDYGTDVAEARKHAAGMTELLSKTLAGVDADKSGTVEARIMEGGIDAAVAAAGRLGLQAK